MFGRKRAHIDRLAVELAETRAENRRLLRELGELDARNARLRQQVHVMRLGDLMTTVDEPSDPIATAEQFAAPESRFGFVVEVTQ